jgi:hypothetical protein
VVKEEEEEEEEDGGLRKSRPDEDCFVVGPS